MDSATDSLRFFNGSTEVGTIYGGSVSTYGLTLDNNSTESLRLLPGAISLVGSGVGIRLSAAATKASSIIKLDSGSLDIPDLYGTGYGIVGVTAAGRTFRSSLSHTSVSNKVVYVGSDGLLTTSSSDERIKQNISELPLGLDFVSRLEPKQYEFKYHPGVVEYGLLAQEVKSLLQEYGSEATETIVPIDDSDWGKAHLPDGQTDALLGMEYVRLIPILINSIKELKAKVDELEQRGF
jgi:hypothetical protein